MPISQGSISIAATNTPQRLASNAVASRSFAILAPDTNLGTVYIGGQSVSSSTGFPLAPGDAVSIDGSGMDDMWLAGTSGDTVRWLAAA